MKTLGTIQKTSSIIETNAWGKTKQPDFLNQVILLETKLSPQNLLKKCQEIENKLGRERKERWKERTIDLDILFYNDLVLNDVDLIIPHPYISERKFVLKPLNEIASDFIHPVFKKSILVLYEELL